jgi:hypothetical protein
MNKGRSYNNYIRDYPSYLVHFQVFKIYFIGLCLWRRQCNRFFTSIILCAVFRIPIGFNADQDPAFYPSRIWIQLYTSLRIQIQRAKPIWIRIQILVRHIYLGTEAILQRMKTRFIF